MSHLKIYAGTLGLGFSGLIQSTFLNFFYMTNMRYKLRTWPKAGYYQHLKNCHWTCIFIYRHWCINLFIDREITKTLCIEDNEEKVKILEECHDRNGHKGVVSVIRTVGSRYYWPNWSSFVKDYVSKFERFNGFLSVIILIYAFIIEYFPPVGCSHDQILCLNAQGKGGNDMKIWYSLSFKISKFIILYYPRKCSKEIVVKIYAHDILNFSFSIKSKPTWFIITGADKYIIEAQMPSDK